MLRILFVANPAAGRSRAAYLDEIIARMREQGAEVDLYLTQGVADATRHLKSESKTYHTIVAVGGDGTVNEVINGMIGRSENIAVIPTGTTNVLATELALPQKVDQVVAMLLTNKTESVYLGVVNGRRFSMMTGIGYDAWVCDSVDVNLKKKLGKIVYVMAMIRHIFSFGVQRYELEIDGTKHWASAIVITNGRHYAGKFTFSRIADIRQPFLQAVLLQSMSRWALLGMLLALPFGRVEALSYMASVSARRISVRAQNGAHEPVQADGDVVTKLAAEIHVEQEAVRFVVPSH